MSVEIAWKQNILVTDFHLIKSLLVVFGFGSQAFVCGFSRQNINSVFSKPVSRPGLFCRFLQQDSCIKTLQKIKTSVAMAFRQTGKRKYVCVQKKKFSA